MTEKEERKAQRQALRGVEKDVFDLVFEDLPSYQRAKFLQEPLVLAAARGSLGLVRKLIEAGAEIRGARRAAAIGGHADVVDHLLENGASCWEIDTSGSNLLHVVAATGHTEVVRRLLLKAGADDRDRLVLSTTYIHEYARCLW